MIDKLLAGLSALGIWPLTKKFFLLSGDQSITGTKSFNGITVCNGQLTLNSSIVTNSASSLRYIANNTLTNTQTISTYRSMFDVDASSGSINITLGGSPAFGQMVYFSRVDNSSNTVTVNGVNMVGRSMLICRYTGSVWLFK